MQEFSEWFCITFATSFQLEINSKSFLLKKTHQMQLHTHAHKLHLFANKNKTLHKILENDMNAWKSFMFCYMEKYLLQVTTILLGKYWLPKNMEKIVI